MGIARPNQGSIVSLYLREGTSCLPLLKYDLRRSIRPCRVA